MTLINMGVNVMLAKMELGNAPINVENVMHGMLLVNYLGKIRLINMGVNVKLVKMELVNALINVESVMHGI